MQFIGPFCLALAILASTHAPAAAQEFDTNKIRVGQTVLVRDLKGAETKGIVQSADMSKLVVKFGAGRPQDLSDPSKTLDDTRTFTPAEVDRVRRPGPIWDGAVKGALIGGLLALLAVAGVEDCTGCGQVFVMSATIGAGIGIGIDAAWGPKTVYRNRGASRKVTLVPVIGRDRSALAASIRF